MHYLVLIISVCISSAAHIFLKMGMNGSTDTESNDLKTTLIKVFSNPWIWGGLFAHGSALLVWLYGLSKVDVSYAYPFLSIGFVITGVVGYFWLGEDVNVTRVSGMVLTVIGVIVVARS